MRKLCYVVFVGLVMFLVSGFNINAQLSTGHKMAIAYGGDLKEYDLSLEEDKATNLLKGANGKDLKKVIYNNATYALDDVSIIRVRQHIKINYYLGDHVSNNYLGSDDGYADVGDSIVDYLYDLNTINSTFNLNLDSSYKLVNYSSSDISIYDNVKSYNDNNKQIQEVNVLITKPISIKLNLNVYQNRQDLLSYESPLNKSLNDIQSDMYYWYVQSITKTVYYVNGDKLDLKYLFNINDNDTIANRNGDLSNLGIIDNGLFVESDSIDTIILNNLTNFSAYLFYDCHDYGTTLVQPNFITSSLSTVKVGLNGLGSDWKEARTGETIKVDHDVLKRSNNKLENYPFHINDDPFDNPDIDFKGSVDYNFALKHQMIIFYNYKLVKNGSVDSQNNNSNTNDKLTSNASTKSNSLPLTGSNNLGCFIILFISSLYLINLLKKKA